MKKLLLLLLVLSACSSPDGIFVDMHHEDCSNGYTREESGIHTPWCSLTQSHIQQLQAGDVVNVRAGTYVYPGESLLFSKSFSPQVTIRNYEDEKVVFSNYWPQYLSGTGWQRTDGIWTLSPPLMSQHWNHVLIAYPDDRVVFVHNDRESFDASEEGIFVEEGTIYGKFSIRPTYVTTAPYSLFTLQGASGIVFDGISVHNANIAFHIRESKNIVLRDVEVKNGVRNAVFVQGGHDIIIEDSQFIYKAGDWYWEDIKGSRMENSAIDLDGQGFYTVEDSYIDGWFNGIVVRRSAHILNNTIRNIGDDAIEIEPECYGSVIAGNMVSQTFQAISLSPANGQGCTIHHNVLDASHRIKAYPQRYWQGGAFKIMGTQDPVASGFDVHHNTIIGVGIHINDQTDNPMEDMSFTNNIFVSDTEIFQARGSADEGVHYDYNLYSMDVDKVQGWDTHSVQADPQLINYRPANPIVCSMSDTGSYVGAFSCIE